jgi:hypothetical protein
LGTASGIELMSGGPPAGICTVGPGTDCITGAPGAGGASRFPVTEHAAKHTLTSAATPNLKSERCPAFPKLAPNNSEATMAKGFWGT